MWSKYATLNLKKIFLKKKKKKTITCTDLSVTSVTTTTHQIIRTQAIFLNKKPNTFSPQNRQTNHPKPTANAQES